MKKKIIAAAVLFLAAAGAAIYLCATGIQTVTVNSKEYAVDSLYKDVMADNPLRVFEEDELEAYVAYYTDISVLKNRTLFQRILDYLQGNEYSVEYGFVVDTDGIREYLEEYNKTATASTDAYITAGETEYVIVSETYGNVVDVDSYIVALETWLKNVQWDNVLGASLKTETPEANAIQESLLANPDNWTSVKVENNFSSNIFLPMDGDTAQPVQGAMTAEVLSTNINDQMTAAEEESEYAPSPSDYLIQPEITAADLQEAVDELNVYVNWSCTYTSGYTISSDISHVSYVDNEIVVDSEWIKDTLSGNLSSYNTVGGDWEFTTNAGENITVSGGTWGSSVSYSKEAEFLIEQFETGVSITERVPEYNYNRDDIGDTYVEVSIQDQHVWVYWDGEMIMDSACVTGDVRDGHDTPTGVYYISECIPGKYLVGDDYETWVYRWMRLTNSGVGLHDAYWRYYFGGNIYKTNGSHGCINLPSSFAYDLYDIAYVGMPVIIY